MTGLEFVGSFDHRGLLNVGESYSRKVDARLPADAQGTGYLFVQTGGPYEFIHTDNNRARSGAIAVTHVNPPKADLEVVSVSAPTSALDGQSIDVALDRPK